MQVLMLYQNSLSGSLPNCIQRLTQLQWLMLFSTHLGGSLPSLESLSQLQLLLLQNAAFSGPIPTLPTSLEHIYLHNNRLTGRYTAHNNKRTCVIRSL